MDGTNISVRIVTDLIKLSKLKNLQKGRKGSPYIVSNGLRDWEKQQHTVPITWILMDYSEFLQNNERNESCKSRRMFILLLKIIEGLSILFVILAFQVILPKTFDCAFQYAEGHRNVNLEKSKDFYLVLNISNKHIPVKTAVTQCLQNSMTQPVFFT